MIGMHPKNHHLSVPQTDDFEWCQVALLCGENLLSVQPWVFQGHTHFATFVEHGLITEKNNLVQGWYMRRQETFQLAQMSSVSKIGGL